MKTTLTLMTFISALAAVHAQSPDDYLELTRDAIKMEKKAAITELMQLSKSESSPFWTLYNDYESKLYGVQNKRIALIRDFAANYQKMTNAKADELWLSYMSYEQELLKLKKSYYKKFKKVLTAGRAAQFFQAENKIEKLIDANVAAQIPLIGP